MHILYLVDTHESDIYVYFLVKTFIWQNWLFGRIFGRLGLSAHPLAQRVEPC